MLSLGRKEGETIRIGDDIIIKVIKSSDGSARIGISAPRELAIVRGELYAQEHQMQDKEAGGSRTKRF